MGSFGVEGEAETMLKAVFVPFVATSHLICQVDTARLFAMHGVDVTIITTPANAATFQSSIDRDSSRGRSIRTHVVKFPQVAGLPQGMESLNADTPPDLLPKLYQGLSLLKEQFEQLIRDMKPDFVVADIYCPWSVDVAAELGITNLVCLSVSYLAHSAMNSLEVFAPHAKVHSDSESFLLPGLPHKLEMTRLQLQDRFRAPADTPNLLTNVTKMVREAERKSYGSLMNSFYELDGTYEEHYKAATGTKSWSVGPLSLWVNQDDSDKAVRGHAKEQEGKEEGVITWLDSKKEDSVLYVSFGSMNMFPTPQLVEIAHALEDSGHDFVWVVGKIEEGEDGGAGFLGEFEKRVKASNKGYLIWGWAPQLLILEHPATGAVVTHCGWNTSLESVIAGLPMVTWPLFGEQFYNEKMLAHVVRVGVPVGAKEWKDWRALGREVVKREDIGKAIALLMDGGEESLEMRRRVKALSGAAKKAIQVGGSSHNNLKQLIEELKSFKLQKVNHKMEAVA